MFMQLILQCLLIASVVTLPDSSTAMEEVEDNSIPLKFYQLPQSKWLASEAKFRRALADDANEFCNSNPPACGFPTEWRSESSFKEQDVKIQSTKADRIYFHLKLYLVLPSNLSKPELTRTKYILHKDVTETIVVNSRQDLAAGVGAPLVSIDGELYNLSPNHTRNIVLICMSFIAVVIVSAIAIYFKCKETRDRKRLRNKVVQRGSSRGSSRENVAIVRPSEKEPVIIVTGPTRPNTLDSPPMKQHFKEPASNDHGQRNKERESFLHLRGRQAPYALPESCIIQASQDSKKQSDKSGHETPV